MNGLYIKFILFLPAIGFLFQAFFGGAVVRSLGPRAGRKVCGAVAVLAVAIPFVLGLAALQQLGDMLPQFRSVMVDVAPWIQLGSLNAPFELFVDPLSVTMVLVITGVGALIHLYATGYMAEDSDYTRFFTYMNLFITSMLLLVLGGNLVLLFVGWEGVGLCSYLLIGFWYKDHANVRAANKAFIFNRIGDYGFMLGIFLLFAALMAHFAVTPDNRPLSFDNFPAELIPLLRHSPGLATAIALLLFTGACGKSAQFPLYSWLPDAMAGPTPVSALIHAATMVTAGVFMLNRMSPVFALSPVAGPVVAGIGGFTALFAALIAFGQTDIKKVLAYSTVSQLGFMFVACGAGAFSVGMFHVVTHAFFKGLLFLGAGAVIHAMAHNQDMRNYGNLRKYMPITFVTMFIAFLAISGFPGTAGFFSKEEILGAAVGNPDAVVRLSGFVAVFTALLTAIYMARLTGLTFFGAERWRSLPVTEVHQSAASSTSAYDEQPDEHGWYHTALEMEALKPVGEADHRTLGPDHTPQEVSASMWIPLVLLAIPSAIAGWLMGGGKVETWLNNPIPRPEVAESAWLPWVGSGAAILGILYGLYVYTKGLPSGEGFDLTRWNPLRRLAGEQFEYDKAITVGATEGGRGVAQLLDAGIDTYLVDGTVTTIAMTAGAAGLLLRKLQTGFIRFYALVMLLGVLAVLGYVLMLAERSGV